MEVALVTTGVGRPHGATAAFGVVVPMRTGDPVSWINTVFENSCHFRKSRAVGDTRVETKVFAEELGAETAEVKGIGELAAVA